MGLRTQDFGKRGVTRKRLVFLLCLGIVVGGTCVLRFLDSNGAGALAHMLDDEAVARSEFHFVSCFRDEFPPRV